MKKSILLVLVMSAVILSGCVGTVQFRTSRGTYNLAVVDVPNPILQYSPRVPVVVNFTLNNGKDAYIRCEVQVENDRGRKVWVPALAGTGASCSVRALRSGYRGDEYVVSAKVYSVPALFGSPQRKGAVYASDSLQVVYEGVASEVYDRYSRNHRTATHKGIILNSYAVESPQAMR